MTSTRSQTMDPVGRPGSGISNGAAGWRWLALGAAAILALMAWNGPDGADRLETGALGQSVAAETQPAFDGRGKWGGYAR